MHTASLRKAKQSKPPPPVTESGLTDQQRRLHDLKIQESFYTKIVERYMRFCAAAGSENLSAAFASVSVQDSTPLSNPTTSNKSRDAADLDSASDLPNILLAMRKLREGILGSRRADAFAQRAYMFIIRASILTRSWESYQPALLYLLQHIHHHVPLSGPELQEFAGYLILDLACRQYELIEGYTLRRAYRVRDRKVAAVLAAVVRDDWVRFWRVKRAVDGHQRAIMEFAVERIRMHALKCLARSYLNADKVYIERCGDSTWEDLLLSARVGWQLQDNGNVVIRKPKPK